MTLEEIEEMLQELAKLRKPHKSPQDRKSPGGVTPEQERADEITKVLTEILDKVGWKG